MPRQTGQARCAYAGCGLLTGGQPFCGNHIKKCDAHGCHRRVRQGSAYCVIHLDYGRTRCRKPGCHLLASSGSDYCGNHRHECKTEGCLGRTRKGGFCTVCRTQKSVEIDASLAKTPIPTMEVVRIELELLIRNYEQVQDEGTLRGQIARDRIPILRRQLHSIQGARP